MVNEIGLKVQTFEIVNGDLKITSVNGDSIYLVGDNNWADLIHAGKRCYYEKYSEMLEKIRPYTKRAKAVYIGKSESEIFKIGSGFSKTWDMVLGIPLFVIDKDSYFDISFK